MLPEMFDGFMVVCHPPGQTVEETMREMEQSWKEKGQDGVYVVAEKTKDWVRFERAMWEVDDKVVEAFGTMDRVLLEKRQCRRQLTDGGMPQYVPSRGMI